MKIKVFSALFALLMLCSFLQISVSASDTAASSSIPLLNVSNIDSTTNRLTWTKIDGAKSYIIYLLNEDTKKYEKYGEIKGTACRDKNLKPNTKYVYKVRTKFSDGTLGKLSEPVSIYTYSIHGEKAQGNWVYCVDYDIDNDISVLYRVNRNRGKKEIISEFDCYVSYYVSANHIFIIKSFSEKNDICSMDLDGSNEKILCSFENDDYDYQYYLSGEYVYNDKIYYSYYGASSEMDDFTEHLVAVDSNGNSVEGIDEVYDAFHSSIFFTENENRNLCIVWMCEELDRSADDDGGHEIETNSMGKYCIYNVDTKQKEYVFYDDELLGRNVKIIGIIDGTVYLVNSKSDIGYISDNGKFVSLDLPDNAINPAINTDNGDIYYEVNEYKQVNGGYSVTKKELYVMSDGDHVKIDDVYIDPRNYNICQYSLYKNYVLYHNQNNNYVYYDLSTGQGIILS